MDKCELLLMNGGGIASGRLPQSLLALYRCTPLQVQVLCLSITYLTLGSQYLTTLGCFELLNQLYLHLKRADCKSVDSSLS
jgi:hypothetical protein